MVDQKTTKETTQEISCASSDDVVSQERYLLSSEAVRPEETSTLRTQDESTKEPHSTRDDEQCPCGGNITSYETFVAQKNGSLGMVAILMAGCIFQAGFNPPAVLDSLWFKRIFQYSSWGATNFTVFAMLLLLATTPTSAEVHSSRLSSGYVFLALAYLCIFISFGASTISLSRTPLSAVIGGVMILVFVLGFSYFTVSKVRKVIQKYTGLTLTGTFDQAPYSTVFAKVFSFSRKTVK